MGKWCGVVCVRVCVCVVWCVHVYVCEAFLPSLLAQAFKWMNGVLPAVEAIHGVRGGAKRGGAERGKGLVEGVRGERGG